MALIRIRFLISRQFITPFKLISFISSGFNFFSILQLGLKMVSLGWSGEVAQFEFLIHGAMISGGRIRILLNNNDCIVGSYDVISPC